MDLKLSLVVLILYFCPLLVFGQTDSRFSDSILVQKYQTYFEQDRKTIHLHLNKTTFASGEHIWLTAYIFNRKQNQISLETEYVYIQLIDSQGSVIDSKTVLYQNGSGHGEIELNANLRSGDYYIQAHTSEMNNFIEDESTVYKIRILNLKSQQTPSFQIMGDSLNIHLQAEGGHLIQDVFGTYGIRITDENRLPINVDSVFLQNSQSHSRTPIIMDAMAVGRFSFTPKKGIQPMIKVFNKGQFYTVPVPKALEVGYSLSVVHDYRRKQLLVAIDTNSKTIEEGLDDMTLLVHKDGNIFPLAVSIDKTKGRKELIIPYEMLFSGVNTLTLIKNGSIPIAERLIFNRPTFKSTTPQLLNVKRTKDSIAILIKNSTMQRPKEVVNSYSISVLPSESVSHRDFKNMFKTFFLDAHLPNDIAIDLKDVVHSGKNDALYAIDKFLLLNDKNKYQWPRILNWKGNIVTPLSSSITGYLNTFGVENDSLSVFLFSKTNRLFTSTYLDEKAKFKFEEIPLARNSEITFTLINKLGEPIYANFFFTVVPTDTLYNKSYVPRISLRQKDSQKLIERSLNLFNKVEQLDEVVVIENRLKREQFFGRFYGRKVDSTMLGHINLGGYMKRQGLTSEFVDIFYEDPRRAGSIELAKKTNFGISFPSVVINGNFSAYAMPFTDIPMEQIDEIYFQRGSFRDAGQFVVFTNENYGKSAIMESEKNSKSFKVENGFDRPKPFLRPTYYNLKENLFKHYGIISWHPSITANTHGILSIKIPDDGQEKIKLFIQGIKENGTYVSESILVELDTWE